MSCGFPSRTRSSRAWRRRPPSTPPAPKAWPPPATCAPPSATWCRVHRLPRLSDATPVPWTCWRRWVRENVPRCNKSAPLNAARVVRAFRPELSGVDEGRLQPATLFRRARFRAAPYSSAPILSAKAADRMGHLALESLDRYIRVGMLGAKTEIPVECLQECSHV